MSFHCHLLPLNLGRGTEFPKPVTLSGLGSGKIRDGVMVHSAGLRWDLKDAINSSHLSEMKATGSVSAVVTAQNKMGFNQVSKNYCLPPMIVICFDIVKKTAFGVCGGDLLS